MTPEESVSQLAEILRSLPEVSEEQAHAAMVNNGIPSELADRAFTFTQVAWGRTLLANLGITFGSDYVCVNAEGDVIESGLLAQNPFFVAASRIAAQYANSKGFQSFALMSAEVNSINNALKHGSDPHNLETGPVVVFLDSPTEAGLQRAHGLADPTTEPTKRHTIKAWWQFWK